MNATAARGRSAARPATFVAAGLIAVAVALIGFAKTFFYPLLTGSFAAHPVVYVHGAFLFGWVAFFLAQALLVRRRGLRLHRRLGWWGAALVVGVVVSTIAVAMLAARRTAATGDIAAAEGELFVVLVEMLLFSGLVAAALALRRRPDVHKRLMLLALIGSLGPAWFRFRHYFPEVGNPLFFYSILLADSLILLAAAADVARHRAVHPVYLFVGTGMILVHLYEVFGFGTPAFTAMSHSIAGPLL